MKSESSWIGLMVLLMASACGPDRPSITEGFRMEIGLTNPSEGLKLSLVVVPLASDPQRGLLFLNRQPGYPPILDYREKGTVRARLADTIVLDPNQFDELLNRAFEAKRDERHEGAVTVRLLLADSALSRSVVLHGLPLKTNGLAGFVWLLFEEYFPRMDWNNTKILLRRHDRIRRAQSTWSVRMAMADDSVHTDWEAADKVLRGLECFDLARLLETNHIWELPDDTTYAKTYPDEYVLEISRGRRTGGWRVFAPSRLADKRYFQIVNSIETLFQRP